MESDHCLSHRKHPSTLFNTFISLLFIYSNTNIISYTTSLVTFTASSPPHSFLKHFSTVTNCIKIQHSTHHTSKLSPRPWLMAPPARSYPSHGLKLPITVLFIFFFSLLPSKSGGSLMLDTKKGLEQSKTVIGSKPPACMNKCKSCRPCMATLVVPNHQKRKKGFKVFSRGDDDTYYLLSWKCKCGDKLFQP
ncbi:hypothetical protein ACSQ67_021783 [Phaseolus vulgaris]